MRERSFDLIVVGSGAAGLSAALKAGELGADVALLTGGELLAGSSPRAQGGVAAAVGADDRPALHTADTLAVGGGLNDPGAVDVLTHEGRRSLQHLWQDGALFEGDLGLEAGHGRRRILHAGGGATGRVLTSALLQQALATPRISVFSRAPVHILEVADGAVIGACVGRRLFRGHGVVLATGGYAALWGRSTNAPETRGAGLGLAFNAGATLADLEFVQFHPTALDLPGHPALLLSEALRGEGGVLIDEQDREIVDPLLPRDVVARALHRHLRGAGTGGQAYLSLRHLAAAPILERFRGLSAMLAELGLDLARDRLPVAPAAHYCMGGIRTDTWGRTDVRGLFAAGEVACTGVQGANRLASNSLLECLVFGARAAEAALDVDTPILQGAHAGSRLPTPQPIARLTEGASGGLSHHGRKRRELLLEAVDPVTLGARLDADLGVERDGPRLRGLVAELPDPDRARSTDLLLASLIARAALLREESRGAHFRTDFPGTDPAWRGRIRWRRAHPPAFEEVLP